MRGGQPGSCKMSKGVLLFSPHSRGSTRLGTKYTVACPILPACAGVNPEPPVLSKGISDSPRMRGGRPNFGCWKSKNTQFTPHARGSTLFIDWPFDGVSIHPACAGVNPCGYTGVSPNGDSPRTRGGQPAFFMKKLAEAQFSPHARGSTHETDTVNSDGIILPACAGVTLLREWLYEPVYSPCMRGGQPYN